MVPREKVMGLYGIVHHVHHGVVYHGHCWVGGEKIVCMACICTVMDVTASLTKMTKIDVLN